MAARPTELCSPSESWRVLSITSETKDFLLVCVCVFLPQRLNGAPGKMYVEVLISEAQNETLLGNTGALSISS